MDVSLGGLHRDSGEGKDLGAVLAAVRARSAALVDGDRAALDLLLGEEFVYVNAGGELLGKDEYLRAYVGSPTVAWQSQELAEIAIRLHGGIAIVTCRVHDRATFDGVGLDGCFRSSFAFVWLAGRWQCILGQTTALR